MEEIVKKVAMNTGLGIEALSALIIAFSVVRACWLYSGRFSTTVSAQSNETIRIQLGSTIALALELLLGADILQTAVAPSWSDIGQLAAIAGLRTGLNFFLARELKEIGNSRRSSVD